MKKLGTSSVVVAAFVGPGTVLTCASAGVTFSYSLGWVMVFATAAVYVLQTFTAGTGILAGRGLGEAIHVVSEGKWFKVPLVILVVLGLWLGSAAFETGNLVGARAGIQILLGAPAESSWWIIGLVMAVAAILLLDLSMLKNLLAGLVALMSLFFVGAALLAPIEWSSAFSGLFVPRVPDESLLTILALVGTTVVTYNLFLHAGIAKRFWADEEKPLAWKLERRGMAIFLPLGGAVSVAILLAGAAIGPSGTGMSDITEFAGLLSPVAGGSAQFLFGLGLLSAGITSAVTAPLAVAAGISELFGWQASEKDARYRVLWSSVILAGAWFSATGYSPLDIIIVAQAANGLLLPTMAGILVFVTVNQTEFQLPKRYTIAGVLVVVFCAFLGLKTLAWVWTQLTI